MIRAFLALPLKIDQSLQKACTQLKDQFSGEKLRWVRLENMHLTIRFFGDIEEEQIDDIADVIHAALREVPTA